MNRRFLVSMGSIVLMMLACNLPVAPGPEAAAPLPGETVEAAPTELAAGEYLDFIVEIVSIDKDVIVQAETPWTWVTYQVTNLGNVTYYEDMHLKMNRNGVDGSGYMLVEGPFEPGVPVESAVAVGADQYWDVGDYVFYITVDYNDRVPESDEENNRSTTINFTVVAP